MNTRIPNWLVKLIREADRLGLDSGTGQEFHLVTRHDDWCDRLAGRGPCNCDPDLRVLDGPPRPSDGA